jgi:hypothetical protein
MLWERDQKEAQSKPAACNEAMKHIFARCCKKMAVQVCTSHNYANFYIFPCALLIALYDIGLIHVLITVYFRRLKINHDSHEFILGSGTVANRYKHTFLHCFSYLGKVLMRSL